MKKLRKRKIKVVDPTKFEFIGEKYLDRSEMQLFSYDQDTFEEKSDFEKVPTGKELLSTAKCHWFNVHGLHDSKLIDNIASGLNVHRLVIQDLLDTTQISRAQDYDSYLFFTVKSVEAETSGDLISEQISFILFENSLITFQERKGDHFEHIRTRLREKIGLVREKTVDYLLFLLLEAIIDNYHIALQKMETEIELLIAGENSDISNPDFIGNIEQYKTRLNTLKKSLLPIIESLTKIGKGLSDQIREENNKFYEVLRDTCLFLNAEIDSDLLRLEGAINMFFTLQNQKMNQIMKTLTIIASIFIPLTFIAGIYGMNFENMPELKWELGYFAALGVMLVITIALLIFFKIRKWFD
jgi:magnesium transporter